MKPSAMKLRPLHDRILVRRIEEEAKTKGGLIIPDTAKEKPMEGVMVAAVAKAKVGEDGKLGPLDLHKGDRVLFGKYSGTEIQVASDEHLIIREDIGQLGPPLPFNPAGAPLIGVSSHRWGAGAGTIDITTRKLQVETGGQIDAGSAGAGRGGTISIDAGTVLIERQGVINASTSGASAAGIIDVRAESIFVSGAGDPRFSLLGVARAIELGLRPPITGIFSARGNGSITLAAPEITLVDGALVLVTTATGDAGDILLAGERIYVGGIWRWFRPYVKREPVNDFPIQKRLPIKRSASLAIPRRQYPSG